MKPHEQREAAELLRSVLREVDAGRLTADGPAAAGLVRRIEGAAAALEAAQVATDPDLPVFLVGGPLNGRKQPSAKGVPALVPVRDRGDGAYVRHGVLVDEAGAVLGVEYRWVRRSR